MQKVHTEYPVEYEVVLAYGECMGGESVWVVCLGRGVILRGVCFCVYMCIYVCVCVCEMDAWVVQVMAR